MKKEKQKLRFIFAGAQTAGHIYPAIALARNIQSMVENAEIVFVGAGGRVERKVLEKENFKFIEINVRRLKGLNLKDTFKSLLLIPYAVLQSIKIIRQIKPDAVVGFGGFSSGPIVLAGFILRLPIAVAEQNKIIGFTNRILSRFVDKIFLSYEENDKKLSKKKISITGNPLRDEILKVQKRSLDEKPFTILILGGSQGSRFLNTKVPSLMKIVARGLNNEISVIHQTGEDDFDIVQNLYRDIDFSIKVLPYIHNIAEVYSQTHFVIARAGGTTIAEINACGLPSLLIPFPYASDNHQFYNALVNEINGASIVIEEKNYNESEISERLINIFKNKKSLGEMGNNAFNLSKREAGVIIAREIIKLI